MAIASHTVAGKLMPDQPEPEYAMAEAYMAQREVDRAIEHYSNAIQLQPGSPMLRERLDEALDVKSATQNSPVRD